MLICAILQGYFHRLSAGIALSQSWARSWTALRENLIFCVQRLNLNSWSHLILKNKVIHYTVQSDFSVSLMRLSRKEMWSKYNAVLFKTLVRLRDVLGTYVQWVEYEWLYSTANLLGRFFTKPLTDSLQSDSLIFTKHLQDFEINIFILEYIYIYIYII